MRLAICKHSVLRCLRHLLLGYELCGAYSLDPFDPVHGEGQMGLAPVTSVQAIRAFLARACGVRGSDRAHETLRCLSDNAWSAAVIGQPCRLQGERVEAVVRLRKKS